MHTKLKEAENKIESLKGDNITLLQNISSLWKTSKHQLKLKSIEVANVKKE